jgi:hypothetical protein
LCFPEHTIFRSFYPNWLGVSRGSGKFGTVGFWITIAQAGNWKKQIESLRRSPKVNPYSTLRNELHVQGNILRQELMQGRFILLCAFLVGVVAFITYLPALKIQFYDGWWYLEWAATMDLPRYLVQFFDPVNITQGYRPVQGLYMYLLYWLFGFNPDGYHVAHNLLHAANSILLMLLVYRLGGNLRVALIGALIYAVLPIFGLAVFWHAVVDPLAASFYFLTILAWMNYLQTKHRTSYWITFGIYILALLSKEISVFLPLFLFLIGWLFYDEQPAWRVDIPRYLPFAIAQVPYLLLVIQVQSHGEFTGQFGFRVGPQMLSNLAPYMAALAFPWDTNFPTSSIMFLWLLTLVVVWSAVSFHKRSWIFPLLALFAVLNISPLLGFPLDYFNTRYLYLSAAAVAILMAIAFEGVRQLFRNYRVLRYSLAAVIVGLIIISSGRVAEASAGLAEYTRQIRVPFRDIVQKHQTFPPDTFLYFVNSPMTSSWDFQGLFFSRYGDRVHVEGTDTGQPANFQTHSTTYVYYFDASGAPIELRADNLATTRAEPALPLQYGSQIVLEKYEVATSRLEPSKALVVVLYWRATGKIDHDYAILAHLINSRGQPISQFDGQPMFGKVPTTTWELNREYVDAVVLPIPTDATPAENLQLELGIYDPETQERLVIINPNSAPIGDQVLIKPFSIASK